MSPKTPEALTLLDTHIGKNITIGTDFRELFIAATANAPEAPPQGFFPMQGDIYLSFQLDPKFLLYYDRGMSNTYEVFGLANVLPWDGYVKAGRFVPSYGWKFDDHTMFVRSEEGFAPPGNSDGGVEVGFSPKVRRRAGRALERQPRQHARLRPAARDRAQPERALQGRTVRGHGRRGGLLATRGAHPTSTPAAYSATCPAGT